MKKFWLLLIFCPLVLWAQDYPISDYDNMVILGNPHDDNFPIVNKRNLVFTEITADGQILCYGSDSNISNYDSSNIDKLVKDIMFVMDNPKNNPDLPRVLYDSIGDYRLRYTDYYLWIGKDPEVSVNSDVFKMVLHAYVLAVQHARNNLSRSLLAKFGQQNYRYIQSLVEAIYPATVYVTDKTQAPPPPPIDGF